MGRIIGIGLFLCVVFLSIGSLWAKEDSTKVKRKIAVLEINTNGVPASFGNIARNSFEVFLFNSDKFQLLDREQLQNISRKLGIEAHSSISSPNLLKLGKSLAADFLISGSIDKLSDYKITIRVISVANGDIITAHSRNFSSAGSLDKILDILTDKTTKDIVTYLDKGRIRKPVFEQHNLYAGIQGNYLIPLAGINTLINAGPGAALQLEFDNLLLNNHFAGLQIGYYRFNGKKNSRDEASFFITQLVSGYRIFFTKWLYLKGDLGAGINIITLSHKGTTGFNMAENSQQTSVDPIVQGGFSFGIIPGYDVNLELGASYGVIFESGGSSTFLSLSAGVLIIF